mmetsp:Transcript_109298/g.152872  ORF Transcript_109298/g.152872 Transcript_109298/m.152872 type:complete len:340 (-) Transcript_109298:640-1659(-)
MRALKASGSDAGCATGAPCLEPGGGLQALVGLVRKVVDGQRHDVVGQVGGDHVLLRDAGDVRSAGQAHDHLQLILEHVDHADDAVLAVGGKGVQHGPAHTHSLCSQSNRLEDIATAAHATIDEDGEVLLGGTLCLDGFHDLRQDLDARAAGVQLTTTVVGEHATGKASLVSHDRVLGALHTLQEHLHLGDALEPRHILPIEAGVNVAADGSGGALGTINGSFILVVALHIGTLLGELVAHVLLTSAKLWCIHGDEKGLHTCILELGHVLLAAGSLRVHVELAEDDLVRRTRLQHLVQGVGAQRGQHVRHARLLGGLHDCELALLMGQLGESRGCEVKRE